jgi:hypothetical protein
MPAPLSRSGAILSSAKDQAYKFKKPAASFDGAGF